MPIQLWIFLIPAAVLLLCGLYTRRKRRKWPSFSVGLMICDVFFLLCMIIVNAQLRVLMQPADNMLMNGGAVYPMPIGQLAKAIVRGGLSAAVCASAYTWFRRIMMVFILLTIVSMVWECYRIFSLPPELAAVQKKLSEREERLHRWAPRTKERKSGIHERKDKL